MTARWVVDEVQPARGLNITWQPISLFFKNNPDPGSGYHKGSYFTLRLMRVMESVREAEGDGAVGPLYWEYGRRIHHDGDQEFAASEALEAVGYDTSHAAAFDDASWDPEIRRRMDEGLAMHPPLPTSAVPPPSHGRGPGPVRRQRGHPDDRLEGPQR